MASRTKGDANFGSTTAVLLCLIIIRHYIAGSEAATFVVGGQGGWTLGMSYGHVSIKSGDTLAFNYEMGGHNVLQVTQKDYNSCDVSRPAKTYTSGKDSVKLSKTGTYYFICGILPHCDEGMKISVSVR